MIRVIDSMQHEKWYKEDTVIAVRLHTKEIISDMDRVSKVQVKRYKCI